MARSAIKVIIIWEKTYDDHALENPGIKLSAEQCSDWQMWNLKWEGYRTFSAWIWNLGDNRCTDRTAKSAIDHYVKEIVAIYDRNKRFEKWFGLSFFAVGLLVPFSFIPNKIARIGVVGALIDTAIMILITWIMFFAAFKFGFFRNRHKEKLQKDLEDWKELKALANDMTET